MSQQMWDPRPVVVRIPTESPSSIQKPALKARVRSSSDSAVSAVSRTGIDQRRLA